MTYSQQLRDRRWQRKRLEVLQRDQWRCQNAACRTRDNDAVMLVVHHRIYRSGKKAWDYATTDLQTLCERCHEKVHHRDHPLSSKLVAGEFYRWRELSALLGFTPTPYLTNANGIIKCATLRKDLNPDAPTIALPGTAKQHWADNAELLCRQRRSIPVFTKEAGLPWEYHGRFHGESFTRNPIEVAIHTRRAKERTEPISLVLFLQPVSDSQDEGSH
jgi:hypothetical protein